MGATVSDVAELTPDLLSDVLGSTVTAVDVRPLGLGNMSGSFRLALSYADDSAGPPSLIAKIASDDPAVRRSNARTYRSEVGFYRDIAPRVRGASPRSYHAALDESDGSFLLLLEDLSPAQPGDQLRGCTVDEARLALINLAGLHASTWNDSSFRELDFLPPTGPQLAEHARGMLLSMLPGFVERFAIADADAEILHAYADALARLLTGRPDHFALLHNDYRLDNLLFDDRADAPRPVIAVDWAVIGTGLAGRDVAFFVATGLDPDLRRDHEHELLAAYNAALTRDKPLQTVAQSYDDYIYGLFQPVMITVLGAGLSQSSTRGDQMFKVMIDRTCAAIRDLDAVALLP